MRVGLIDFINSYAFTLPFKRKILSPSFEVVYDTPSKLYEKLRKGELDLAFTSSVAAIENDFSYLPSLGIAAHGSIQSVTLYYREPMGSTCALTPQSKTSVKLLEVLFEHHWKREMRFSPLEKPWTAHNAFLLIGDEALKNPSFSGYKSVDLATAWYEMSALPFVFGLFCAHPTLSKEALLEIEKTLFEALEWSEQHMEEVIQEAVTSSSLSFSQIEQYLKLCHHRLGKEEHKGLATFANYLSLSTVEA